MNMKKIMAAGIAATMAVTSLAAVASAETLTFNMAKTEGTVKGAADFGGTVAFMATAAGAANANIIQNAAEDTMLMVLPASVDNVKLSITGTKGTKDNAAQTYVYTLDKYVATVDNAGAITGTHKKGDNEDMNKGFHVFGLTAYKNDGTAPLDSLVVGQYVEITQIKFTVEASKTFTEATDYNATVAGYGFWENKAGTATLGAANGIMLEAFDDGTGVAAGSFLNAINGAVTKKEADAGFWMGKTGESTTEKYAMLPMTTAAENQTIDRYGVKVLSDANDKTAENVDNATDGNQSYLDNGMGDRPYQFAGLASQVADFFNHQTNGTITFKFTTGTAGSSWSNGGVPSTQVGIKNKIDANNFALYLNYRSSTGSLQATTSVDKSAGTVTFDISEILADLGGQTKGVVNDIFYGLNQGIEYKDPYNDFGLLVEEVTLAYEEEAEEEDIPDEEEVVEEEEEEEEVAEEEEEEEEVAEEEEEVAEEEEEEEEEEVDGEMVDEEPTAEDEAADENPGTGVALAVVPAIMAAAAVVVSKKRK